MKQRVQQHGDVFEFVEEKPGKILIRSLDKTFGGQNAKTHWLSWITPADADTEIIKTE